MKIERATRIAEKYKVLLSPSCSRIEIAGSIRRQRKEVGDIELVCIPKTIMVKDDFFGESKWRDPAFVNLVNSFERIKGIGDGKYCQIKLDEEINLDLFITTAEQWGVIFMIRTGSAAFSKRMVTEIKYRGYKCEDGYLKKILCGQIIPCYEEKDFFLFTGQKYIEPELRVP